MLAEPSPDPRITGTYVCLSGRFEDLEMHGVGLDAVAEPDDTAVIAFVGSAMVADRPPDGAQVSLRGRVVQLNDDTDDSPVLDTTAGRFHPASIAGLVVGAMGAFVFSVALRHWLRERRAIMAVEGP